MGGALKIGKGGIEVYYTISVLGYVLGSIVYYIYDEQLSPSPSRYLLYRVVLVPFLVGTWRVRARKSCY